MTTYVKTDYVPENIDYLTKEKVYEIYKEEGRGGYVYDDVGEEIYIFYNNSAHIGCQPWTICDKDGNEVK